MRTSAAKRQSSKENLKNLRSSRSASKSAFTSPPRLMSKESSLMEEGRSEYSFGTAAAQTLRDRDRRLTFLLSRHRTLEDKVHSEYGVDFDRLIHVGTNKHTGVEYYAHPDGAITQCHYKGHDYIVLDEVAVLARNGAFDGMRKRYILGSFDGKFSISASEFSVSNMRECAIAVWEDN